MPLGLLSFRAASLPAVRASSPTLLRSICKMCLCRLPHIAALFVFARFVDERSSRLMPVPVAYNPLLSWGGGKIVVDSGEAFCRRKTNAGFERSPWRLERRSTVRDDFRGMVCRAILSRANLSVAVNVGVASRVGCRYPCFVYMLRAHYSRVCCSCCCKSVVLGVDHSKVEADFYMTIVDIQASAYAVVRA